LTPPPQKSRIAIVKSAPHRLAPLLALAILLTGCQPAPPAARQSPYLDPQQTLTPDQLANSDPCSMRLHDVAGLLLIYYAKHSELPQDLDQLQTVADVTDSLDFTCPDTHQPYVYIPGGIRSPTINRQIIVYDSTPHPNGVRWCIFLSPATLHPGASLVMDVLPVSEATFQTFQHSN
jgi:hypothetical protein